MADSKGTLLPQIATVLATDRIVMLDDPTNPAALTATATVQQVVGAVAVTVPEVLTVARQVWAAGNLNVSTEGTIDWLANISVSTVPRALSGNAIHSKSTGGDLLLGFDWVVGAGTATTGTGSSQTITSTAGDDMGTTLSANTGYAGVTAPGAVVGVGWRIRVPVYPTQRVLRVYCSVFSAGFTVTAKLLGGVSAPVVDVVSTGAAGQGVFQYVITYAGSVGMLLSVTGLVTTNLGSTPNVINQAATIASV